MSEKGRARVRRIEAKRPPSTVTVVRAESGEDRTEALVAELLRMLDTAPPAAQG